MLNKLLEYVAKWSFGEKVVSSIGWVHDKLDGKKTEIFSALYALSYGLELAGLLPTPAAEQWGTALTVVVPLAFADRASKIAASIKKVAGQ